MTPALLTKHQCISMNLAAALYHHCPYAKAGRVFSVPTDVIFTETDVVQPDLLYIAKDHDLVITRENIQGSPDLIVGNPLRFHMPPRLTPQVKFI